MADYMYPSVFFAYFLFLILAGLTVFFFVHSLRDGYWGPHAEDAKYRMLEDEEAEPALSPAPRSRTRG